MIIDEEDFLEHVGVKGMHWGVRKVDNTPVKFNKNLSNRQKKKDSKRELNQYEARNNAAFKEAAKDPTFKREVKATKKRQGISGMNGVEKTKEYGQLTNRVKGDFRNSKGEKVSEDFANAVLAKAIQTPGLKAGIVNTAKAGGAVYIASAVIIGASFAASMLSSRGGTKLSSIDSTVARNLRGRDVIKATSRDVPYVKILGALGKGLA